MENLLGALIKLISQNTQASTQTPQVTQIGWNDAPGGGFIPVFSNEPNPPKYRGMAPQIPPVPLNPPQTQQQTPDTTELQRKLTKGFINLYGKDTPALQYIPQMVEAVKNNQFHRNNPYLAAAQLVAESSGGANITRPNNPTNWGIAVPGNNAIFSKMNTRDVFDKYLTGIAGRDRNYKEFNTGKPLTDDEFSRLAKKYVGPADTTYGQRLKEHISYFENQ